MPIEELLSLYFRTLHDTVAQYYGKRVRDCALGVPTRFTQASIDLMVEAAKQGGLRVKTTIVEPVAVALAHGIDDTETFDSSQPKYVLVFDLGWSSADVTLLRVVQGLIAVESSLQETQVSGQGFVDALVDLCVKEFKRKSRLDCTESLRAMMRLRRACEDSMKILSTSPQSNVDIDSLYEGCDFSYCITRARFEDVAASVFPLINTALSSALENAGLEASDVSLIICGGAVSKIPRVQQILQGRFPDARNGVLPVDAEETVAMGAALHAHYLVAANAMNVIETLSSETRTLSVCVGVIPGPEGSDAEFVSILPEGSVLPVSANVSAVLASGPEESAVFQVRIPCNDCLHRQTWPAGRYESPRTARFGASRDHIRL
jgi:molecular chaperone DnaK (HSP70)